MDGLKKIISENTQEQLAEYIFHELSTYEVQKLSRALTEFAEMIDRIDYNSVRAVPVKKEAFRVESEIKLTPNSIVTKNLTVTPGRVVGYLPSDFDLSNEDEEPEASIAKTELGVPKPNKLLEARERYQKQVAKWQSAGYRVDYSISKEDGITKVYIRDENNQMVSMGKAICDEKDKYNPDIGKLIAMYRASFGINSAKFKLESSGFAFIFKD